MVRSRARPAVFLDRDGVINVDRGYVGHIAQFEWVEGARAAIARLKQAGFLVFIVTNQSGVARGYYTEEDVRILHAYIAAELAVENVSIDAFHYCPFLPGAEVKCYDSDSPLRKPAPGMLLDLMERFDILRDDSFMIGDKDSDMEAARRAGVKGLLFTGGNLDTFVAKYVPLRSSI